MHYDEETQDTFVTDHLQADLGGRSVRGGMMTFASQGTQFLIQSVATVVLARLLVPADFGLVAMVTAITGLAQSFADLGLSEATIQNPEIDHSQVSILFWINVAVGAGLTAVTALLAPVIAWFYGDHRLLDITLLSSLAFLIGGLRVQHDALLKRQMRFSSLAIRDVTGYLVAVPSAIFMAWKGAGYWAIIALPLILNSVVMLLSWVMVRWIPGPPRRGVKVRSLISFGGNVAASYLTLTGIRSADNILIGWYWGASPLGLYSRAYNLLLLPIKQLSTPLAGVVIPALSRIQDAPERLARYYLRAVNLMLWMSAPLFGFLFAAATPVIVLALGNQWRDAAPVFRILSIFAMGQLLVESTVWLLISRGASRRLFKAVLIMSPIILCSYAIGLPFGIRGVAMSGSIVQLAILPWLLKFSFQGTSLGLKGLMMSIVRPISVAISGVLLAQVVARTFESQGIAMQLLQAVGSCVSAFLISLLVPGIRHELNDILDTLRKAVSQRWPKPAESSC